MCPLKTKKTKAARPANVLNRLSESRDSTEPTETAKNKRKIRGRPRKINISDPRLENMRAAIDAIKSSDMLQTLTEAVIPLESIAENWIGRYKDDKEEGIVELIRFFICACGCKGALSVELYSRLQCSDLIRRLTDDFEVDSNEYPIMAAGYHWKKFRTNFALFLCILVDHCKHAIVYDQYMMKNIISFLTGLTDCKIRAFRHTGTLAVMKIMSSLIAISLSVIADIDNASRQLETENIKVAKKRVNDRIKTLRERLKSLDDQQSEITEMTNYLFKFVFMLRYRDVVADIRIICITELSHWIIECPAVYLQDNYLKYIGWTIFDRSSEVRLTCLRCLQPMYDSTEISNGLEQFSTRFKPRIVEMTNDKDSDTAVQAIRTLIAIYRYDKTVLSPEDCGTIFRLVFSINRNQAKAAGDFLHTNIQHRVESSTGLLMKSGKTLSSNALVVKDLISFYVDSQFHDHMVYLVESVYETCPGIKDWGTMTDLLLEEPMDPQFGMNDQSESVLIELMVFSIKQTCSVRQASKKLSAKDLRHFEAMRISLSEHFILNLARLCSKFIMDEEKIANLLEIIWHVETSLFAQGEFVQRLEQLLRLLEEIIEKHVDYQVLESCSRGYMALCAGTCAVTSSSLVSRNTVLGQLTDHFTEAYQRFFQSTDNLTLEKQESTMNESVDLSFALSSTLKKIMAFYCFHDLSSWNLWAHLYSIMRRAVNSTEISADIIITSIRTGLLAICWGYKAIREGTAIVPEDVKVLEGQINEYKTTCECLMMYTVDSVVEEAYVLISDLLLLFGPNLGCDTTGLHPLCVVPSTSLTEILISFLNERVFGDNNDQGEENRFKRRNFLLCFCKFIMYGVFEFQYAIPVLRNYVKFNDMFGDIIKPFITKLKEIDRILAAKLMIGTLVDSYRNISDPTHMTQLRELSRKFALSFGLDNLRNRDSIAVIHHKGIKFALREEETSTGERTLPNISFIDVVNDFTFKVIQSDKNTILQYLDRLLETKMINPLDPDYPCLSCYRGSLMVPDTAMDRSVNSTIVSVPARRQSDELVGRSPKKCADMEGLADYRGNMMQSFQSTLPSSLNTPARFRKMDSINEVMSPLDRSMVEFESGNVTSSSILSKSSFAS